MSTGWASQTAIDWYGRFRVLIDHTDVTWFRGIPTRVVNYQLTDPFGYGPAQLALPQVTSFEVPRDSDHPNADLPWLRKGALVDIQKVSGATWDGTKWTGGTVEKTVWSGFIVTLHATRGFVSLDCAGELSGRMSLTDRQIRVIQQYLDIGELIRQGWLLTNVSYRFDPNHFTVGRNLSNRAGANQSNLDYVNYLLNFARTSDGDWTLMPKAGQYRVFEPRIRDLTTIDFSVDLGASGIDEDLSDDATEQPNRFYGSGISRWGEAWENICYPNLGEEVVPDFPGLLTFGMTDADTTPTGMITVMQYEMVATPYFSAADRSGVFDQATLDAVKAIQTDAGLTADGEVDSATWQAIYGDGYQQQSFAQAWKLPLAADPRTVPLLRAANGNIIGKNPDYDQRVLRVDRSEDFGDNADKDAARAVCQRDLNRSLGPNWLGTITLTSDAATGDYSYGDTLTPLSGLDIEAGMNGKLRHFAGANPTMHVSAVTVSNDSGDKPMVQLMVDEQGRDPLTLEEIIERRAESRAHPGRVKVGRRRGSSFPLSAIQGWYGEDGAGILRTQDLKGGQWNILATPGAQEGIIRAFELHLRDPVTTFAVGVFSVPVTGGLTLRIPDPLGERTDGYTWVTDPAHRDFFYRQSPLRDRLLYGSGAFGQSCGYGHGRETDDSGNPTGDPVNGDFYAVGNWPVACDPGNPLIFVAIWPVDDCTMDEGGLFIQLTQGL